MAKLAARYRDGWFTSKTSVFNHTIFGLLALERVPVPAGLVERTTQIVEANRHADGGYTSYPVTGPATYANPANVDSTGAALAGLCGAGRTLADASVSAAVAFLRSHSLGLGDVDAAGWALGGMAACGLHRGGPGWTGGDEATIDWLLGGQLTGGPDAGAWGVNGVANPYATQNALHALADPGFFAAPPPRANPVDPLLRAPATVADGTPVPVVLAIDPGFGNAHLCSTTALAGASLTDVLAAAGIASAPPGCVSDVVAEGGAIVRVDGAVAAPGGGWKVSLGGAPEQPAGTQAVPYGAVVGLRLEDPLPLTFDPAMLDFGAQSVGLLSAVRPVVLTNRGTTVVTVERLHLGGTDAGDFMLASQTCVGETLAPGATCEASVRFSPGAPGARWATLAAEHDGAGAAPAVALAGSGGSLPQGPPGDPGMPGTGGVVGPLRPTGSAGAAGAAGSSGRAGRRGGRGPAGRNARVTCRLVDSHAQMLTCNVRRVVSTRRSRAAIAVRLVHGGLTFARGTIRRPGRAHGDGGGACARRKLACLQLTRRLTRGSYVLILGHGGARVRVAVRLLAPSPTHPRRTR